MLYYRGEWFLFRSCHDPAHGSTREAPWQRSRRRADTIRARLAGTRTFPDRPPRMRWGTYQRLRRELFAAEGEAFDGFVARHEELIARFERKPKMAR